MLFALLVRFAPMHQYLLIMSSSFPRTCRFALHVYQQRRAKAAARDWAMDPASEDGQIRFVKAFEIYFEASRGIGPFLDEGFRAVQR